MHRCVHHLIFSNHLVLVYLFLSVQLTHRPCHMIPIASRFLALLLHFERAFTQWENKPLLCHLPDPAHENRKSRVHSRSQSLMADIWMGIWDKMYGCIPDPRLGRNTVLCRLSSSLIFFSLSKMKEGTRVELPVWLATMLSSGFVLYLLLLLLSPSSLNNPLHHEQFAILCLLNSPLASYPSPKAKLPSTSNFPPPSRNVSSTH